MYHDKPEWIAHQREYWTRPDADRWLRPDAHRWMGPEARKWLLPDRKLRLQPQPYEHGLDLADEREWLRRTRQELASLKAELKFRQFFRSLKAGFRHDQPRVPASNPDGGRWTREAGGGGRNDPRILSDATPDNDWQPGAQYAQNISDSPDRTVPFTGEFPSAVPPGVDVDRNMKEAEDHKSNFLWFYDQVRNKGLWDFKQLDPAYADFGNFNFGAAGRAAGFSEETLLRAAGWAQVQAGTSRPEWGTPASLWQALLGIGGLAPFGDDPRDQFWISQGFRYYDAYRSRRQGGR